MNTDEPTHWTQELFDDLYGDLHLSDISIYKDHASIIKKLISSHISYTSNKSIKIQEQCSGVGHLLNLLSFTYPNISGYDIQNKYITKGLKLYPHLKNKLFVNNILEPESYTEYQDIILNIYSSLGYFNHDSNLSILQKTYDSLNPNGCYILELPNSNFLIKNFKEKFTNTNYINKEKFTTTLITKLNKIPINKTPYTALTEFEQKWEIRSCIDPTKINKYSTQVIIYSLIQLQTMLKFVGFKSVTLFNEDLFEINPTDHTNERSYILAKK